MRVEVLKALQYVSADNTVAVKGRVACEINSGDELLATEIIFAGALLGRRKLQTFYGFENLLTM